MVVQQTNLEPKDLILFFLVLLLQVAVSVQAIVLEPLPHKMAVMGDLVVEQEEL
jgi:hypothetical protein